MTDFHTSQTPKARTGKRKGERWATRQDELAHDKINTMLSWRDYLQDVSFAVVLWCQRGNTDVVPLAGALNKPAYTLYFGRKSCPLGRPPHARTETAAKLTDLVPDDAQTLYCDALDNHLIGEGWRIEQRSLRRDQIHRRKGWMFAEREEWLLRRNPNTPDQVMP